MKSITVRQCSPYIGSTFAADILVGIDYHHGFVQDKDLILQYARELLRRNPTVTIDLTRECLIKLSDPRPRQFSVLADVRHCVVPDGKMRCITLAPGETLLGLTQKWGYGAFTKQFLFMDDLDITKHELLGEQVVVICGTKPIDIEEVSWLKPPGVHIEIDNRYWAGTPSTIML